MDKKAVTLTIEIILIIILSLAAVAMLSFIFARTSTTFWDRIKNYFSGPNVDEVVKGCNILADTQSTYAYCCEPKTVKYYLPTVAGQKKKLQTNEEWTCSDVAKKDWIPEPIRKLDCSGFDKKDSDGNVIGKTC